MALKEISRTSAFFNEMKRQGKARTLTPKDFPKMEEFDKRMEEVMQDFRVKDARSRGTALIIC